MNGGGTVTERLPQVGAGREVIERIAPGEPAWRRQQRERAWQAFESAPMPNPRTDEDWRRTSLAGLELAQRPVGFDGEFTLSCDGERPEGLLIADLAACSTGAAAELWQRVSFGALPPERAKFVAAAEAFATAGGLIHVPDGVELETPIVLRHEITGPASGFGAFRHLVISLGAGARARVIVIDRSDTPLDGVFFSAIEVTLADGAHLEYTGLQALGTKVMRFENRRAVVGRDAAVTWVDAELGGRLARAETESRLARDGAEVCQRALVYGDDRQHIDLLNRAIHVGRHTTSDLFGRVALDEHSRSVYRGIVHMPNGCAGANSQQACNAVLLDGRARSDAIPSLFIDEDDVRAGHGATAGPLDENQIFYMQARGIPRPVAEHLILEGFFAPVLERVQGSVAEPLLREIMARKLAHRTAQRG